jgi:hypothetical protein
LVDIETEEREVAAEGESAFGFTVRDIQPESVLLAQGDDEFVLRLGEKEIPVSAAPQAASVSAPAARATARRSSGQSRSARRSASRRTGGSRRSSSRRTSRTSSNRRRGSSGRSWANRSRSRQAVARAMSRGGRRSPAVTEVGPASTSNPQTARRRETRLIGGAEPLPTPRPLANPQTQRRRGTTQGPAFGEETNGRQRSARNQRQRR